jgi:hypothetical protein
MSKRKRRPQRTREEQPEHYFAFLNERYIAAEVVDIREDISAYNAMNGIRRIRHPYARVDVARNRIAKKFLEMTQHPLSTVTMLDTDHAHKPETVHRLLSHKLPIVGALAFRRGPPFDPQAYKIDGDGSFQPATWTSGVFEWDIVGTAALCIQRKVFTELEEKGHHYPWFRMMYEDKSDTLLGEDWYFGTLCMAAGIKMHADMGLVAPHQTIDWIGEEHWQASHQEAEEKWGDLKDKHKGETCIIIGNGPSLKEIPQDFLKKYPTFGTNRIYAIRHLEGFHPTYYAAVNPLVLDQFGREMLQQYKGKVLRFFLRDAYVSDVVLGQQPAVVPLVSSEAARFFTDPSSELYEGFTVTFVCMQLAYYMGFSKVLLVGVDHRYTFEGDPNQELVAQGPDINHADDYYFSNGAKWNAPDLKKSEEAYQMAREAFEKDGREIINITPNTALETFELGEIKDWM